MSDAKRILRDVTKAVRAFAPEAVITTVRATKHTILKIDHAGKSHKVSCSQTPACADYAIRNICRDIRRKIEGAK